MNTEKKLTSESDCKTGQFIPNCIPRHLGRDKGLRHYFSFQIIIAFLLTYILVITSSFIILYAGLARLLTENSKEERQERLQQSVYNLDSFCTEIDNISRRLASQMNLWEMNGYESMTDSDRAYYATDIINRMNEVMSNYEYIQSICFYGTNGLTIKVFEKSNEVEFDSQKQDWFYHSEPYQQTLDRRQSLLWYGGYTNLDFSSYEKTKKVPSEILYLSASRSLLSSGQYGILTININMSSFTSLYNNDDNATGDIFIMSPSGIVQSSNNESEIGVLSPVASSLNDPEDAVSATVEISGQKKQVSTYPLNQDMVLVSVIPLKVIVHDLIWLRYILLLLYAAGLVMVIVLSTAWIRKLMLPLYQLMETMKQIEGGQLGLTLANPPQNDLGELIGQFNEMSLSVKNLFDYNLQVESDKWNLEMKALQRQINPHFIYNTLNIIKWMALIRHENDIADCITTFADYLEPIFRHNQIVCSLKDELNYASNYIKIINYRCADGYKLEIQADSALQDLHLIRFIIQPVVENAVVHGFQRSGTGTVRIKASIQGRYLLISISNNGQPFQPEELRGLQLSLAQPVTTRNQLVTPEGEGESRSSSHVGLANVNRRIQMFYGKDCGITVGLNHQGESEVSLKLRLDVHLPDAKQNESQTG